MLIFTPDSPSTGDQILRDAEPMSHAHSLAGWISASLLAGRGFGIFEVLAGRMGRPVKPSGEEEEEGPRSGGGGRSPFVPLPREVGATQLPWKFLFLAQCQLEPGRLQGK